MGKIIEVAWTSEGFCLMEDVAVEDGDVLASGDGNWKLVVSDSHTFEGAMRTIKTICRRGRVVGIEIFSIKNEGGPFVSEMGYGIGTFNDASYRAYDSALLKAEEKIWEKFEA